MGDGFSWGIPIIPPHMPKRFVEAKEIAEKPGLRQK